MRGSGFWRMCLQRRDAENAEESAEKTLERTGWRASPLHLQGVFRVFSLRLSLRPLRLCVEPNLANHHSLFPPLAEQSCAHAHASRPFFDRRLQVVRHAHGKLAQPVRLRQLAQRTEVP